MFDVRKPYDIMERGKRTEPGIASESNKSVQGKQFYIHLVLNHFDGIHSSAAFQLRHYIYAAHSVT